MLPSRRSTRWMPKLSSRPIWRIFSRLASWSTGSPPPGTPGTRPSRQWSPAEPHPQVLVAAGFLQVAGEQLGEGDLVQVVVLAGREPRLDGRRDLLGQLREHVVLPQQRQRPGHDVRAG